jgi:hypothetical protein
MVQNDTTNGEPTDEPTTSVPLASLGEADVRIDVDEATYQRLHEAYCRALECGYSEGFDTFAYNYCSTDCHVTVEGEPVEPDAEE